MSAKATAQEFGVHHTTVSAHLNRLGIAKHRLTKLTDCQIVEAAQLREQGWSWNKIGARFRVSGMTVRRALDK